MLWFFSELKATFLWLSFFCVFKVYCTFKLKQKPLFDRYFRVEYIFLPALGHRFSQIPATKGVTKPFDTK